MFADDTTVLSHGKSHSLVSSDIQSNLNEICRYTTKNRLVAHPGKTKALLFSKRSQASCTDDRTLLKLDGVMIEYVRSYKCLGFMLNEHLDYSDHMKDLCRKLCNGISIIRRVREYLPHESLANLANSHVLSHLDYCSPPLRNLNNKQLDTLLKLQKQCARVIYFVT